MFPPSLPFVITFEPTQIAEVSYTVQKAVLVLDNDSLFNNKLVRAYIGLAHHNVAVVYLPANTPLYQVIEPTLYQVKHIVRDQFKVRHFATHLQLLTKDSKTFHPNTAATTFVRWVTFEYV